MACVALSDADEEELDRLLAVDDLDFKLSEAEREEAAAEAFGVDPIPASLENILRWKPLVIAWLTL